MTPFRVCTAVLVGTLAVVLANPINGDDARISALRQRIDDLDAKIKQVVRDIAVTNDQAAIQELNRQKKQYETQKSTAVYDLYKAREAEEKCNKLKAEVDSYARAVETFNGEARRQADDVHSHNRDAENHRQAVTNYKNLPPAQQTQWECDRLNRWRDLVNTRASVLDERTTQLRNRKAELDRWQSRLKAEIAPYVNSPQSQ